MEIFQNVCLWVIKILLLVLATGIWRLFLSVLLSAVLFGRFFVILGELRRRLNVTDCGGGPVPCLLRYSRVGNLPKCVIKNFLSVLVRGILRLFSPSYFPRYCLADFLLYWGWLRRRLTVTDCGGDPVPCLLRYSMVGNLPKYVCVWVIKNLLSVLVCGTVWQIFCYTGDSSGGV